MPIDGSDTARRGLTEALRIASSQHAQVRIVYVFSKAYIDAVLLGGIYSGELLTQLRSEGEAILTDGIAQARNSGVFADSQLIEHSSSQIGEAVIFDAQRWHADLIVMGTHGRRGIDRAITGSDAEYVLRHATVPVLLLRC